jgi:hypothetical protein
LGGGGQRLKEFFLQFYSDVACKAWLVLKKVGKVGILNLRKKANHHWGSLAHD